MRRNQYQIQGVFHGMFCHEYREKGELFCSYGFGKSEAEAREDALYWPAREGDAARNHPLGYGDWVLKKDRDGSPFVVLINKNVT